MRLDWTEPWSRRLVRMRLFEAWSVVREHLYVTLWGSAAAVGILLAMRLGFPATSESLGWWRLMKLPMLIAGTFLGLPCLTAVFPQSVHLREKDISFQVGSVCSHFSYDRVESILIADRGGFHLFIARVRTKKGSVIERLAVASPKVPDAEIVKFLAEIGQVHLVRYPEAETE